MTEFFSNLTESLKTFWKVLAERWQPTPGTLTDDTLILIGLLITALIVAVIPQIWRWSSYFITVFHEGGHALAALLVGSKLHGIKIRWDRSGETQTVGSRFLPFRIWTTWWGYPFPAIIGALYLWSANQGWQGLAITVTLFMSVVMFLQIRSLIAFVSITATMIATWALWWYLPPTTLALILYALGWFLIFGGIQSLINLTKLHLKGDTSNSDATALQEMTLIIPAFGWLGTFWFATLFALVFTLKTFFLPG